MVSEAIITVFLEFVHSTACPEYTLGEQKISFKISNNLMTKLLFLDSIINQSLIIVVIHNKTLQTYYSMDQQGVPVLFL